nr:YciI family protein [Bacteroidales bacterium]
MQFVIKAFDGAGQLDRRMEVRPRHFAGMAALGDHILCAGAMLDEAGRMKGSVLVVEFAGRAELDAYLAQEPYVLEKVWDRIEIEPMNVAIVGGAPFKK